ncbi:hypothetical protein X801_10007, partial [Opisthorchis viverrini]
MMRFTRMAIVITFVYITCVSYDAFAYLAGRTVEKRMNNQNETFTACNQWEYAYRIYFYRIKQEHDVIVRNNLVKRFL